MNADDVTTEWLKDGPWLVCEDYDELTTMLHACQAKISDINARIETLQTQIGTEVEEAKAGGYRADVRNLKGIKARTVNFRAMVVGAIREIEAQRREYKPEAVAVHTPNNLATVAALLLRDIANGTVANPQLAAAEWVAEAGRWFRELKDG